MTSVKVL